jgi:hypothetical protein
MLEALLHPQPKDAPCRGDRDPLITDMDTVTLKREVAVSSVKLIFLYHTARPQIPQYSFSPSWEHRDVHFEFLIFPVLF